MNFRNKRLGRQLAADYTIIMLMTLKETGNHVKFARFVLLADLYIFIHSEINNQFQIL